MIKIIMIGIWISISTLASFYSVMIWKTNESASLQPDKYFGGLEYVKTSTISVPIISEGKVAGYVLARFVFLADKKILKRLSVPADVILVDEAFRIIYASTLKDFQRIEKYDLAAMTRRMQENANRRFEVNIIRDVLIDSLNYVPKNEVRFRGLRG